MNRVATALSIATAFAAGCGLTHYMQEAIAAEPMKPQIIHTGEMEGDALGAANKVGFRSKMFAAADGATVSIQDGDVPKHLHPNANEIQFILEGTGCAGPLKASMRFVHASQASLSASRRASAARSAAMRTEVPSSRSRDLVPISAGMRRVGRGSQAARPCGSEGAVAQEAA